MRTGIVALLATVATSVLAQGYPAKPARVVVPYPPGGPTDIVARVVSQKLSEQMGQQFVVENRPGAGGNIGAEAVAKSPGDGYTLLVATTAHAINPSLFKGLGYNLTKDFAPVSQLTSGPLVIVANPSLPAKSVQELIALAKAKPGTLNYASSGNGQSTHLSAELFATMAGIKLNHIPYKGSAPALTDVMGGQIPLMMSSMLSVLPHVKAGKLKLLALSTAKRSPALPDVPTVAESGLPGYEATLWYGIVAAAHTPAPVLSRLSGEIEKTMRDADIVEKLARQGVEPYYYGPQEFAARVRTEIPKWTKVIKEAGVRAE